MNLQQAGPWQDPEDWTGTSNLKILLDHPQGVFYPGNQVGGKISFELEEPKPFVGLRLKCEGEGLVYFTDRSAGFRRKFSNEQSYVSEEIYLFGDGDSEVTIPAGESVFRFSVSLPEKIPCSFEGRYGRVRYSISASLERTKLVRMTETVPFTVAPVLDLNRDPLAPLPISEDNSKAIVGQGEPLDMSVTIPVRGFVPGQSIPVKIVIKNACGVEIRKLRVVMKKVTTYHTERKSRRHKEIIVEIEMPVTKECSVYETGVDVPAVPPTGMLFCSIIDVWYTLKVEAFLELNEWYLRMLQKNLKTRMRIVVGTIPLRNYETPEEEKLPDEDFGTGTAAGKNCDSTAEKNVADISISEKSDPNLYAESKIYPSSKPNRDDPTGDYERDCGSGVSFSPLYRVYTFKKNGEGSPKSRR